MLPVRFIATIVLGLLTVLGHGAGVSAAPVPTLEGTWLLDGSGDSPAAALVTFRADGAVAVAAPGESLALPDGIRWPIVSAGSGVWRSRGFPEAEMAVVFLLAGPDAVETPVLKLSAHIVLAQTGRRWTGEPVVELLDGGGRARAVEQGIGPLGATRVLYGRW